MDLLFSSVGVEGSSVAYGIITDTVFIFSIGPARLHKSSRVWVQLSHLQRRVLICPLISGVMLKYIYVLEYDYIIFWSVLKFLSFFF